MIYSRAFQMRSQRRVDWLGEERKKNSKMPSRCRARRSRDEVEEEKQSGPVWLFYLR